MGISIQSRPSPTVYIGSAQAPERNQTMISYKNFYKKKGGDYGPQNGAKGP